MFYVIGISWCIVGMKWIDESGRFDFGVLRKGICYMVGIKRIDETGRVS